MSRPASVLVLVLGGVLVCSGRELLDPLQDVLDSNSDNNVTTWLPRELQPLHYRVRIQPVLQEDNFTAPAELEFIFRARVATDRVTLNVRDLSIHEGSVGLEEEGPAGSWTSLPVARHEYDAALETYSAVLESRLTPRGGGGGRYRLKMRYVAQVGDNLRGLYRVQYQDENNNKRWMAMTQLHPTNARTMFPCMDEPQYKARFTLSIARQDNYTSLANMPLSSSEPVAGAPGWHWDHFQTSVPMSSYLIALAVFDFGKIESSGGADDVTFRVWAPRQDLRRGEYAARIGPAVLKYYSDIFNISFPLPKQDMVAAPKLTFGAMENWGLIFFREEALLVDAADPGSQHHVGETVSHELAHQWFGNLVTMRWWNDVWLNEGFATYMSQRGLSHVERRWQSEDVFVLDNMQGVMHTDALPSSHPVSREVHRVADIDNIFDAISYKKGSSVVRMMSRFLGESAFQSGLNSYLSRHSYGSAAQDDLWAALTEAAHRTGALTADQSVKTIMDSWTLRTGFPVVTLTRDYCTGTANVTQQRFSASGSMDGTLGDDCCWGVPLWVKTAPSRARSSVGEALHWLQGPRLTLRGLPGSGHWVLANGARAGYYRVNYDATNWRLLAHDLDALTDLERAGLVDDALALAGASRLEYDVALDLVRRLPRDRPSLAWLAALPWISRISHLLHGTQQDAEVGPLSSVSFSRWSRELAADLLRVSDRLRDSTDPVEHAFSTRVRRWACGLGVPACAHRLGLSAAAAAKSTGVRNMCETTMTEEEWNATLNAQYKDNASIFLKVAECVKSDFAVKRMLEIAFYSEDSAISQTPLLKSLAANPYSFDAVMQFLKENWDYVQETFGTIYNHEIVKAVAPFVKSPSHMEEMKTMASTMELPQCIEEGKYNMWWLNNQAGRLMNTMIQTRR